MPPKVEKKKQYEPNSIQVWQKNFLLQNNHPPTPFELLQHAPSNVIALYNQLQEITKFSIRKYISMQCLHGKIPLPSNSNALLIQLSSSTSSYSHDNEPYRVPKLTSVVQTQDWQCTKCHLIIKLNLSTTENSQTHLCSICSALPLTILTPESKETATITLNQSTNDDTLPTNNASTTVPKTNKEEPQPQQENQEDQEKETNTTTTSTPPTDPHKKHLITTLDPIDLDKKQKKSKKKSKKEKKKKDKKKKKKNKKPKHFIPKLLPHQNLRKVLNTSDTWGSDTPMLSLFFSWEEWTSEQLRTGSLLLQHHCAKQYRTTYDIASSTTTQLMTSSLLQDMYVESSTLSHHANSNDAANEQHAALMVEHLALGQPSDLPPFTASHITAVKNNTNLYEANALQIYVNILEVTTAYYLFNITMAPAPITNTTSTAEQQQLQTNQKIKKSKSKKKKKKKSKNKRSKYTATKNDTQHIPLWRILNCLYMLMTTNETNESFLHDFKTCTVGTTGRSIACFILELLSYAVVPGVVNANANGGGSTGTSKKPKKIILPIRKLAALAALSVRMQCGSLEEIHTNKQHNKEQKKNSKNDSKNDQEKTININASKTNEQTNGKEKEKQNKDGDRKPNYSLKATKGKIYDAEYRKKEHIVDAALSGITLSPTCKVLTVSERLRGYTKHHDAQSDTKQNTSPETESNEATRNTPKNVTNGAMQLFHEIQSNLRNITVVMMQLLLSCAPRKGELQQQLLVDGVQDLRLERTQQPAYGMNSTTQKSTTETSTTETSTTPTSTTETTETTETTTETTTAMDAATDSSTSPLCHCNIHERTLTNNMYVSRCVSQTMLGLLKSFRATHVLHGEVLSQHLMNAKCILTGLSWLNYDVWKMQGGLWGDGILFPFVLNHFETKQEKNQHIINHQEPIVSDETIEDKEDKEIKEISNACGMSLWQASCVNVLRVMQRVTKIYPERIQNNLIKYNASIVLKNVLFSLQNEDAGGCAPGYHGSATYYVLKLFKSQLRYLLNKRDLELYTLHIDIINGISQNIRIELNDNWLVTEDNGIPGEGMHHPTELATKWVVQKYLEQCNAESQGNNGDARDDAIKGREDKRNDIQLETRYVETKGEIIETQRSVHALSILSDAMVKNEGYGDDRTVHSGPDGMLCLDGVDGIAVLSGKLLTNNVNGRSSIHCNKDLEVEGVGMYALYNDPSTDLPNGFEKGDTWMEWLNREEFVTNN